MKACLHATWSTVFDYVCTCIYTNCYMIYNYLNTICISLFVVYSHRLIAGLEIKHIV